jgi:hypothetical protein
MKSKILFINCPSEYFSYIPMGTFGLCDYLRGKGINARILNLALYSETESDKVLAHYLNSFQPTHIGLIFHWQETAEGFLWAGERIRSHSENVQIIAGGFTAGYFGENLLEKCRFLDHVVKGDPEKPLELLLEGMELSEIPNLIYRRRSKILSNRVPYFADSRILSRISFSDLTCLYDHDLYLEAINRKLGFPVFIGRGCIFNCDYCGGSRSSFRLHSAGIKPVVRAIDAVIADLKRLKDFTKKIYLCYEIDPDYIKALFRAIKEEETLIRIFQLNYGAWQLFDREFMEYYKDLFILPTENRPIFELSPEVFDDRARKKIKHRAKYSIRELKENPGLINDHLGGSISVSIFFSRYHDTIKTYKDMKEEIYGIFRLKHDLFGSGIENVHIAYDHLSTDVGSRYWESYIERPRDFDTLISAIRKLRSQERYSFPVDNLCIYVPDTLSEEDILRCEMLVLILKMFERYFFEFFHVMFKCLGESLVDLLEEIINEFYSKKPGNIFHSFDHAALLGHIRQKIVARKSLSDRIPFIEDLTRLNLKKAALRPGRPAMRSSYQTNRPQLNHEFISPHDHDYLDIRNFLKRIGKEGVDSLKPERTVFIFLAGEILSMAHETYNSTLKEFEKGISLQEYYEMMEKKGIFSPSYHKDLIAKLFASDVLY